MIGVVTHDFSHTHHGHISFEQLIRFPLVFIPVWWIWTTHTLYANRFDNDDRMHRFFALIVMGLLVLLSTFIPQCHYQQFQHFTLIYVLIRVLLAGLYLRIDYKHHDEIDFAQEMALAILIGAIISASSIFYSSILKYLLFYAGILIDITLQIFYRHKTQHCPVNRKHLVERVGLLAIIILGESVISMINSLSHTSIWDTRAVIAAVTGFTMVWSIWWIYFDSFSNLERAKRITDGNVLICTHLFLCMGLIILANMIGHSIKHDLDQSTFRMLAIFGMCGFYFGKQVIYYHCFPPFRPMIIINTVVCLSITIGSTFLANIEYALIGITLAMLFYVYSTLRWLLPHNIDAYLDHHVDTKQASSLVG